MSQIKSSPMQYVLGVLAGVLVVFFEAALWKITRRGPFILPTLAVLGVVWRWGRGAAYATGIISTISIDIILTDGSETITRVIRILLQLALVFIVVMMRVLYVKEHETKKEIERSLKERIQVTDQMVELQQFRDRFLGAIGHDLRQPLAVISMVNQTLKHAEPDRTPNLCEKIDRSLRRMEYMIRDLQDYARMGLGGDFPLIIRQCSLHEVCLSIIDELRQVHTKRRIIYDDESTCDGYWDPIRLQQVIANLVGNAINYSPADEPVIMRLFTRDGWASIEVYNKGPVIPSSMLPTLFEPYKRGPSAHISNNPRGLGLGLYIVKQIVNAHQGKVEVISTEGDGTMFKVQLPCDRRISAN